MIASALIDGFEMMSQRFAANGHALLQHHLGLHESQRIPFDGVGVVGVLEHHVLTQVPNKLGRKGTMGVQFGLQASRMAKASCCMWCPFWPSDLVNAFTSHVQ